MIYATITSEFLSTNQLLHIDALYDIMKQRPFPSESIIRWPDLMRKIPDFLDLASSKKSFEILMPVLGQNIATLSLSEFVVVRPNSNQLVYDFDPVKIRLKKNMPQINLISLLVALTPLKIGRLGESTEIIQLNAGGAILFSTVKPFEILSDEQSENRRFVVLNFFDASKRSTSQMETEHFETLNISRVLLHGENGGEICNYSIVWPGKL